MLGLAKSRRAYDSRWLICDRLKGSGGVDR
jgi:hypothetical protein